jgi:cytochrome c oxidase subunit 2
MSSIWIIVALILGFLIVFQIAKASEYVAILKGEEKSRKDTNKVNAFLLLAFLIVGLFGVWYCNEQLKGKILGEAASEHGERIDTMMWITLAITGFVFVVTQILLFWFSFKYQEKENRTAYFYPQNNKLELIWTVKPALTLTQLVGFGLYYWFQITGEAPKDSQVVEITGKQFNWEYRYPGKDGVLGKKYYKNIDPATNPLGQIWDDKANHDDIYETQELHVVVGKPVKLVIYAKDVIHDVGLPHFRMKMDAVPGIVTTMWFTPRFTTAQMKKMTDNPNFVYEISCDQMCGKGHYSMRGTIVVQTQAEYDVWMATQKTYYAENNTPAGAVPTVPGADSTAKKDSVIVTKM